MPPKAKKPRAKKTVKESAVKVEEGPKEVFLPADKTLPRPPGPDGYKGVTYGGKQTEGEW